MSKHWDSRFASRFFPSASFMSLNVCEGGVMEFLLEPFGLAESRAAVTAVPSVFMRGSFRWCCFACCFGVHDAAGKVRPCPDRFPSLRMAIDLGDDVQLRVASCRHP